MKEMLTLMTKIKMIRTLTFIFALVACLSGTALAQEFEIKQYNLEARVKPAAHAVEVQAKLSIVNLSAPDLLDKLLLAGQDKPRLTFFLHPKTKVAAMTLNGNAIPLKTAEDVRNNLLRVSTDINSAIASVKDFEIGLTYTIDANDRTSFLRVSEGESFLLPPSQWFPSVHTPFGDHGADTAPFIINVVPPPGQKVISSGIRKSETSFEQTLAALPFFIVGDFELISRGGSAAAVEVYVQRGVNEAGKQQAQRLLAEAEKAVAFSAKYFGVPASAPWRAISTSSFGSTSVTSDGVSQSRESAYATTGTLFLDDSFFRRDVLDIGTIELIASSASRAWIDGRVLVRGRGNGMLRDALPIYLIARYLGERNGPQAADAAFERYRRAYAPLARGSDAPLLLISPLDRNYTTSMFSKGALVWRLLERKLGTAEFDRLIRQALDRQNADVLTLIDWKGPLCGRTRCVNTKALLAGTSSKQVIDDVFTQWIETVVVPDFAIGQPQKTATGSESTIVNFGNGEFAVDVVVTTDKGEKLSQSVTVKGGEYGSVVLPADKTIVSVEADPEKVYPQKDYSNDSYPRRASPGDLFGQANLALSNNDLKNAESKGREALAASPDTSSLMAFLGRVLVAAKKNDEAAQVFTSALKDPLITIQAYVWAHLGLGSIAAEQKQFEAAATHFRLAASADVDVATSIAARNGLIAAELELRSLKISDDVRAILKSMDAAILQSSAEAVSGFVDVGNLRKFAQSLVIRKPSSWTTEPTRAEELDANRIAVDVNLKLRIDGKDWGGRALYILRRTNGKLLLTDVPIFDVK